MKTLLIGATGATGKDLLSLLLNDGEFEQVDIFVRRQVDLQHEKLSVHLIDFDRPEEWRDVTISTSSQRPPGRTKYPNTC